MDEALEITKFEELTERAAKPPRFLTKTQVLERVPITWKSLWDWMRAEKFPLPYRLVSNKVCWLESEIDEWILSRERREDYKQLEQ